MKPSPFFSIIIPTLNEEKYLPHLLKDLSNQTFSDFQVIIVDGQSEDKTVQKAKLFTKIQPNLLVSTQKNVALQRNLGAKNSQGKWLIFFDADTRIPKYFLEGIKYQISKQAVDIFTCWMKPDSQSQADLTIASAVNLTQEIPQHTNTPQTVGAMMGMKHSVFKKLKGFDINITFGEDTELSSRAVKLGCQLRIFRDPQFQLSLRRVRKEGTIGVVRKIAKLNLDRILSGWPNQPTKEYPMLGGNYYQPRNQFDPFLDSKIVNQFKKLTKSQKTKLKTILDYFTNLDS